MRTSNRSIMQYSCDFPLTCYLGSLTKDSQPALSLRRFHWSWKPGLLGTCKRETNMHSTNSPRYPIELLDICTSKRSHGEVKVVHCTLKKPLGSARRRAGDPIPISIVLRQERNKVAFQTITSTEEGGKQEHRASLFVLPRLQCFHEFLLLKKKKNMQSSPTHTPYQIQG